MQTLSIFAGHDANIVFAKPDQDEYRTIEIERLVKKRYFRLHADNPPGEILEILCQCQRIAQTHWGFSGFYDSINIVADGDLDHNLLTEAFRFNEIKRFDHHRCHAAGAFYQSPFLQSVIISYDGGGNDGFFNVYQSSYKDGIKLLESIPCDFGGAYMLLSSLCTEVTKGTRNQLALPGKLMGLCAYGKTDGRVVEDLKNRFINRDFKDISINDYSIIHDLRWQNILENYTLKGQESYDFAANIQKAYETKFLEIFENLRQKYNIQNLCLTGGGALNVLLNQIIKNNYDIKTFVPPNPNDCGLALGASFLADPPKTPATVAYSGLPLLDFSNLSESIKNRPHKELDLKEICQLLKQGKIIGICRGDSEVGPRALGNRSIICDPSYKNMKDILNSKVKFREWYRPFAPFCLKEDAPKFFESKDFDNFEFMSYAPLVKEEYRTKLPAITHVDNSSRLQCVTQESHQFFYDLLREYKNYADIPVLLNTSFNIRGFPILSTIKDALSVLDNTELDYVIFDNVLVGKSEI